MRKKTILKSKDRCKGKVKQSPLSIYDQNSWRIFRIMAEFVDGFEVMSEIGPAVTVFGSARLEEDNTYYKKAKTMAFNLAKAGYAIITGGGPGIMQAANQGAKEAQGRSVGLNIELPMEQEINPYVNIPIGFRYFFVRKVMFIKHALAAIIMPGGMGTLDELFELVTLIQTEKINPFPVILVGKEYWQGLLEWMKEQMVSKGMLDKSELDIIKIMDNPQKIVEEIKSCYKIRAKQIKAGNF